MKKASIYLDRAFTVGTVDPRLFGSFLEHLGRAIYGGIYEPHIHLLMRMDFDRMSLTL